MRTYGKMLIVLALLGIIVGCGGGGARNLAVLPASSSPTSRTGSAVFQVTWPQRTRLIPAASNSIRVDIKKANTLLATQLLTRPAAGATSTSTTFPALPPGSLTATATAFPTADGSGTAQALAQAPLTIQADQTTHLSLTMGSTIDHLEATPPSVSLVVNQSQQMVVTARDASGNAVLLAASALQSSSDTPGVARIDPGNVVIGVSAGSARLTFKDSESGKSVKVTVTVTGDTSGGGGGGGDPWPLVGHDAQNSRIGTGTGAKGIPKWKRTDITAQGLVLSKDGTLFANYFGTVYALDSTNGQTKWQVNLTGYQGGSTLALGSNGKLYFAADSLFALDPSSGQVIWQVANGIAVGGITLDANNVLYTGINGGFAAFNGETGIQKWATNISASATALGLDGTLYLTTSYNGTLHALDSATGTEKWKFTVNHSLNGGLVVGPNNLIYFGDNNSTLHAVDTTLHTEKWEYTSGTQLNTPEPYLGIGGAVYAAFDALVALDGMTGAVKWRTNPDGDVPTAMCVGSDGMIYADGSGPRLHALDGPTGGKGWTFQENLPFYRPPIIGSDGTLYVSGGDGLRALQ